MSARRWLFSTVTAGFLVLATSVPAGATSSTSGWRVFTTVSPHNAEVQFNAVTALSRNDAWAVGPLGISGDEIVEQWNGRSWRQMSIPGKLLRQVSTLSYISALSSRNVWAMDINGDWLHFNGSHWSVGRLPGLPGGPHGLFIEALAAAGSHAMWAIGWDETSTEVPYAAYYNGKTWKPSKLPARSATYFESGDLSVVSADSVWALLSSAAPLPSSNVLMHWNGRKWSVVALPSSVVKGAQLQAVLALSNGSVWVGGFIPQSSTTTTAVVARLAGHSWQVGTLPSSASVTDTAVGGLIPDGGGGIWAGGTDEAGTDLGPIWHYQSGKWSAPLLIANTFFGRFVASESLAHIPGTKAAWGVGGEYGAKAPNHEVGIIVSYGKV